MPNTTYARTQGHNRFGRRYHGRFVTKGYLKSIIGVPEIKWHNVSTTSPVPAIASVDTSTLETSTYILNTVGQGNGDSQRIGNEISNKSLHLRFDIRRAAVDSVVRVIVYWNRDGTEQPASDLLEDNTPGRAYRSPLNKNFGKTFWVRFDRTYSIAAGQTQLVVEELWRRFKCKTEFEDASTNCTANLLFISFISDQTDPANQPLISFTSRVNYMDV